MCWHERHFYWSSLTIIILLLVDMNMPDEETLTSLVRNHRLLIDKTNKYCNDSPVRNSKWEEIE
jgi:hypothetical protein